jgi:uncharacterized repeat protein (TIGR01451 family)
VLDVFWFVRPDVGKQVAIAVTTQVAGDTIPEDDTAVHHVAIPLSNPPPVAVSPTPLRAALTVSRKQAHSGDTIQATATIRNASSASLSLSGDVYVDAFGAPATVEVLSVSGDGWSCTPNWGRAQCRYTATATLASGEELPALQAALRIGPGSATMWLGIKTWNGDTSPYEDGANLWVQQAQASGFMLASSGCAPLDDCDAHQWPHPTRAFVGAQIQLTDVGSGTVAMPWIGESDFAHSINSEPSFSEEGLLASIQDARQVQNASTGVLMTVTRNLIVRTDVDGPYGLRNRHGRFTDFARPTNNPTNVDVINPFVTHSTWTYSGLGSLMLPPHSPAFGPPLAMAWTDGTKIQVHTFGTTNSQSITPKYQARWLGTVLSSVGVRDIAWSRDGRSMVYSAGTAGQEKLWIVSLRQNGDGSYSTTSSPQRLTQDTSSRSELRAAWSPDGSVIAFSAQGDLRLIGPDGSGERVLSAGNLNEPRTHPEFSPRGDMLAYQRGLNDPGIFIIDLSSGQERLLTRGQHPAFSRTQHDVLNPTTVNPVAAGDEANAAVGHPAYVNVLDNDSDPAGNELKLVKTLQQPTHGTASCGSDGTCVYTPSSNYVGDDIFTYQISNSAGYAEGRVLVHVNGTAPDISINTPTMAEPFDLSASVAVTGTVQMRRYSPKHNALFMVDLFTDIDYRQNDDRFGTSPPRPAPWPARPTPPAVDACADLSEGANVVDCFIHGLTQDLAKRPELSVGALAFGLDGDFGAPSYTYYPNAGLIDLDPAPGQQSFISPITTDRDGDERPDIEQMLHAVQTTAAHNPCSPFFPAWTQHCDVDPTMRTDVGYSPMFFPYERTPRKPAYDHAIDAMNRAFATADPSARNVAFLFSGGRTNTLFQTFSIDVSDGPDSPLMQAVRAGTIINTYGIAQTDRSAVDFVWDVSDSTTMGDEQTTIRNNLLYFAESVAASDIDYRVILVNRNDYFASTPLGSSARYVHVSDRSSPIDLRAGAEARVVYVSDVDEQSSLQFTYGGQLSGSVGFTNYAVVAPFFGLPSVNPLPNDAITLGGAKMTTCATAADTLGQSYLENIQRSASSICDQVWTSVLQALLAEPAPRASGAASLVDSWSCKAANNALQRIATLTGGTCTDLTWDHGQLKAPIPPLPDIPQRTLSEVVDHVEVVLEHQPPVRATLHPNGSYEAVVQGLHEASNLIRARVVTKDGLEARAETSVQGLGGWYDQLPVAQDDFASLRHSPRYSNADINSSPSYQPVSIDLLANDSDADGDALTLVSYEQPSQGQVDCDSWGSCYYWIDAAAVNAEQTFGYVVRDSLGGTARATVHIVPDVNRAPFTKSVTLSVRAGESIDISPLTAAVDPEGDPLNIVWVSSNDFLGVTERLDDTTLRYAANANAAGIDSMLVDITDGDNEAYIDITITVLSGTGLVGTITPQPAPFTPAAAGKLVLRAGNAGDDILDAPSVQWVLPRGVVIEGFEGDSWFCESTGAGIKCQLVGSLAGGEDAPLLSLFVNVAYYASSLLEVEVTSSYGSVAKTTVPIAESKPDLTVVLDAQGSGERCDEEAQNLVVRNVGSGIAQGVKLHGTIDEKAVLDDVHGTGWSCALDGSAFTCERDDVLASATSWPALSVVLHAIDATTATQVLLQAQLSSADDANADDDTLSATLSLGALSDVDHDGVSDCLDDCPLIANPSQADSDHDGLGDACDLSVDLALSVVRQGKPEQGQELVYDLLVANLGTAATSSNVVVQSSGSSDLALTSAVGEGWSCAADAMLSCTLLASLPAHANAPVLHVRARVLSPSGEAVFAGIVLESEDTATVNNVATDRVDLLGAPDLAVILVAPSDVQIGQTFAVSAVVENRGIGSSTDLVSVQLGGSAGLTIQSASGSGWSCNAATCTTSTHVSAGDALPAIALVLSADLEAYPRASIEAFVSTDDDVYTDDDHALAFLDVQGRLDVALASITPTSAWQVDGSFTVNTVVSNTGTLPTQGTMRLTQQVPPGLVILDVVGSGWACAVTNSTVVCETGAVTLPGASAPVVEVHGSVTAAAYPDASWTATVATNGDVDSSNDSAQHTLVVSGLLDLGIDNVPVGAFSVGNQGLFLMTVRNAGNVPYAGTVTVTDQLPAGLTLIDANGPGWQCTVDSTLLRCAADVRLDPSASAAPVTVHVQVTEAALGATASTATLAAAGDMDTSDDRAVANVQVTGSPDLALTLTRSAALQIGAPVIYTTSLKNIGSVATGGVISVRQDVPPGFTVQSASGTGWSCNDSLPLFCTTTSSVAAGANAADLVVKALPGAASATQATWTATVLLANDHNSDDDTASDTAPVSGNLDAALASAHTGTFAVGQSVAFALTVLNAGQRDLTASLQIADVLPAGATLTRIAGAGWTCSTAGSAFTCTSDVDLAPGAFAPVVTAEVLLGAGSFGSVSNTARVTTDGDANSANDVAIDVVDVDGVVDVALSLTRSGDVPINQSTAYLVTVSNTGNVPTQGAITVTETVPTGMTLDAVSGSGWSCTTDSALRCTYSATLAAGAIAPAITATAHANTGAPAQLTWIASASTAQDAVASNNTASDTATMSGGVDLSLDKSHGDDFRIGVDGSYTLRVTNVGARATSQATTIVDTLPNGMTYRSASGRGWTCTNSGATVRCSYAASMRPGVCDSDLTIVVRPTVTGILVNRATVQSPEDGNASNDADSDATTVHSGIDAQLKLAGPSILTAGQSASYVLSISNVGAAATTGLLTVGATIPSGLTYGSSSPTSWSCSASSGLLQCSYSGTLAANASAPALSWSFAVSNTAPSTITLQARVSTSGDDNAANDSDALSSSVRPDPTPPTQKLIELWPPNHKFVGITLDQCVTRTADCPGTVTGSFTYGSSDEPVASGGSNAGPDITFDRCTKAELRAERQGEANGRVYRLGYDVVDRCGNRLRSFCRVEVPHDQGFSGAAHDDGERYRVASSSACP